jgi:hypothetical protein
MNTDKNQAMPSQFVNIRDIRGYYLFLLGTPPNPAPSTRSSPTSRHVSVGVQTVLEPRISRIFTNLQRVSRLWNRGLEPGCSEGFILQSDHSRCALSATETVKPVFR